MLNLNFIQQFPSPITPSSPASPIFKLRKCASLTSLPVTLSGCCGMALIPLEVWDGPRPFGDLESFLRVDEYSVMYDLGDKKGEKRFLMDEIAKLKNELSKKRRLLNKVNDDIDEMAADVRAIRSRVCMRRLRNRRAQP